MTRKHFAVAISSAGLAASLLSTASYATPGIEAEDIEKCKSAFRSGDNQKTIIACRRLAEQGHSDTQIMLGMLYELGVGIPQDYKEAAKWFLLAAEQGDPVAQSTLGWLYFAGEGVPQDYNEAAKWFRLADEH